MPSTTRKQLSRSLELLPEEPSKKNYWLDKGFSDLGATIRGSFAANRATVSKLSAANSASFKSSAHIVVKLLKALFYIMGQASVLIFGGIITLLFSTAHSAVILCIMSIVYLLLAISRLLDEAYRLIKHTAFVCDWCKNIWVQPGYICPCCRSIHARLRPNAYGIFVHRCQCGQLLPATPFVSVKAPSGKRVRRSQLLLQCPNPTCSKDARTGEFRPFTVSIVGGRSVGKTAYIAALTHNLVIDRSLTHEYDVEFLDSEKEKIAKDLERFYAKGETDMTVESADLDRPSAFSVGMLIHKDGVGTDRSLHLYDIAGETFQRSEEHEEQLQYNYTNGVVLLIDPMSIPAISDEYSEQLAASDAQGSAIEYPDNVLSGFIEKVKHVSGLGYDDRISFPLAVCINKADQPGIGNHFDDRRRTAYLEENPACPIEDVEDALARDFLLENGMGNLLNMVLGNFQNHRFFVMSAIGHRSREGRFKPYGVAEPFAWIVGQGDAVLKKTLGLNELPDLPRTPFAVDPKREKKNATVVRAAQKAEERAAKAAKREADNTKEAS